MKNLSRSYLAAVCLTGMVLAASQFFDWESHDILRFGCYLIIAVVCSGMTIKLPGVMGTMSVNFLFILMGILDMTLAETMMIGCIGALAQWIWKARRRTRIVDACFSLSN